MATRTSKRSSASLIPPLIPFDRRDRMPGTHFARELGAPSSRRKKQLPQERDPHVDEDLGCSAFGIDLLRLGK
jgi:hypothetical protein